MSEENPVDPKRRHRRVRAALPVRVSTIEAERDPWTGRSFFRASQETCADLSRGGVFVRTTELLEAGRRVLLELQLPDGAQVETIGRVAWTRRSLSPDQPMPDSGVGVEFLGGAALQLTALEEYLSRIADESEEEEEGDSDPAPRP